MNANHYIIIISGFAVAIGNAIYGSHDVFVYAAGNAVGVAIHGLFEWWDKK